MNTHDHLQFGISIMPLSQASPNSNIQRKLFPKSRECEMITHIGKQQQTQKHVAAL